MLHRRPGPPTAGGSGASQSSTYSAPPVPTPPSGNANTAYTPLKRRESAQLYPSNNMLSGSGGSGPSRAPRYPLPSPGAGSYSAPAGAAPGPGLGSGLGGNGLGLSSPINIVGGGNYPIGAGGGSGGHMGYGGGGAGGNTYDLSRGGGDTGAGNAFGSGDVQERIKRGVRQAVERCKRGVEDALRLDRSWNLVWNDAELKLLILKSSLINLLSLFLLSFFSIVVSPSLGPALSDTSRTKEVGMWYNLLLSWPVFAVCFWINASWGPDISRRAQTLLHPSYRHQPSPVSTPLKTSNSLPTTTDPTAIISAIFKSIARLLLIADFTLVSRLISLVPVVGRLLAFAYMSIITSYYCFEWNFSKQGWSLDHRILYVQERTAYMVGFGFLPTFLTSFGSPLVNMSIFALLYPFFVIQALLSRPPVPRSSTSPNTPSPGGSLPTSPMESGGPGLSLTDPFFTPTDIRPSSSAGGSVGGGTGVAGLMGRVQVPLFLVARWGLLVLGWFEDAVGRKVGGRTRRERAGKRLG